MVSTDILLTGFGLVCCVASKSRIKQVHYVFFMDNEQFHGNQCYSCYYAHKGIWQKTVLCHNMVILYFILYLFCGIWDL